jgi:hypothetical protein
MENFITGYPGHEYQMRKEMKKVLGEEKYEYFFDKFLEYFFTEDDAKLFSELGLNCLRLPVGLSLLVGRPRRSSPRSTTVTLRTT